MDILLWGANWMRKNQSDFDDLEVLREYLRSIRPNFCGIRVYVPASHGDTIALLKAMEVSFIPIDAREASPEILKTMKDKDLGAATQTALACDADVLVTNSLDWFPYIQDFMDLGLLIADSGFLLYYCEIFVRGHEVPWAFVQPVWDITWNGFYHFAEQRTLSLGLGFLYAAQKKNVPAEGQEAGRSFIHNRLPNICFTRDRLLFYEMQRWAAQRAGWKRQEFNFELSYYLNFYYPLIFGGFDHLALIVNHCLGLGLSEKNVGATYKGFLDALQAKNAKLHGIFADPNHVAFMKRIAALRHYASHRGSLAPAKIVDAPKQEPTDAELDAEIAAAGADIVYRFMPQGELRDSMVAIVRHNFKMAHYEKGKVIDGVVLIEIDGKKGFISPINDTSWNFQKLTSFMNEVFMELAKAI
jgi:hypothetical protein